MGEEGRVGIAVRTRTWAIVSLTFAVGLFACSPVARGADEHVYDPKLSLVGGTGVTSLDPIPDPGSTHPKKGISDPCGVATDAYGNVYVANGALGSPGNGVIDVFDSDGEFVTEVADDHWPCSIAVGAQGSLYVFDIATSRAVRYDPLIYEPDVGQIAYDPVATEVASAAPGTPSLQGMGLDPSNDHLYVSYGEFEAKYRFDELLPDGTAAAAPFSEDVFASPLSLAIFGQTHDIYSSGSPRTPIYEPYVSRVYAMDATTHEVKLTLDGSNTPAGDFGFVFGKAGVAVDQSNGDIYVDAMAIHHVVDQFDNEGNYIGQLALENAGLKEAEPFSAIAVDQGANSPNRGYVYVTSGFNATNSHLYAFAPRDLKPPEIRSEHLEDAGETEALLAAEVNAGGAPASYHFEYGAADCASNPCQSAPVPDGQTDAGGGYQPVSTSLYGLTPGTTYHYRLVVANHCNLLDEEEECITEGSDHTFSTFEPIPRRECPNAAVQFGPSSTLADCRAYELVTPPDTNGRIPTGAVFGTGVGGSAPVLLADANGASVVFGTEGGTLSGSEGGGFYDTFLSTRGPNGWRTEFSGLRGVQAQEPYAGAVSSDHAYSFWSVPKQKGSLPAGQYLRSPDGTVEALGVGSLGSGEARGRSISPGGAHVVFSSSTHLEPGAPPNGTTAIYDRGPGAPTHVVSLLPGELTPGGGENAAYLGTAETGTAVVFRVGNSMYARLNNTETVKVGDDPAIFGGMAADGSRVFYLKGGDVFSFDTATRATVAVGSGGKSTLVNVSGDGSHVYFISPVVLTGSEVNDHGAVAASGGENLYVWDEGTGTVRFIATVEEKDVTGESPPAGGSSGLIGGLGLWVSDAVSPEQQRFLGPANDPSRTSTDGRVLVFESRAELSGYGNEGHPEIYRYDAEAGNLICVSCNPTNAPAVSGAQLESRYAPLLFSIPPVNAVSQIANLAVGGNVVFFQSGDRLAAGDRDNRVDVYEWEARGTKGCERIDGCTRLISGGRSPGNDYLYGASADGSSVFFVSGDTLVPEDSDSSPSIYVAREGGGFPPASTPPADCAGEACQPTVAAPEEPALASSAFVGAGNPGHAARRCPKGTRKSRGRGGKAHCVRRRIHRDRRAGR
jgi:hypothetical protein